MVTFDFLDKSEFDSLSKDIFCILVANMSEIAPTGNSYEDDYNSWYCALKEGLAKEQQYI